MKYVIRKSMADDRTIPCSTLAITKISPQTEVCGLFLLRGKQAVMFGVRKDAAGV
jgi:hypothetical protein